MANAIFLKIDGAPGTSLEANHKEWIDIESYSFGGSQASTQSYGSGAGSGRVSFQDFHFTVEIFAHLFNEIIINRLGDKSHCAGRQRTFPRTRRQVC